MTPESCERGLRAFIAIPLPEDVRRRLALLQKKLADHLYGVRWAKPDSMHLTLKFFADVPEECLEKIGEVMLSVKPSVDPFPAAVSGIGAFPSAARPRVIWAGFQGGKPLTALHAGLEKGFSGIGIPRDDRPFTPHLTLGRCPAPPRGAADVLERYRAENCGELRVERMILYESRLRPSGAVHRPVKTVELG